MHWRSPIFSSSVLVRDPSEQNDCCNWETGMNVGFVGLGIMGAPMAGHLQKGGHALFLYDLSPDLPEDLLAGGAVACDSGRAVAEASDIVILMVPDTPDVAAALFADNGVAGGLSAGKLLIDMSSISPTATTDFARRVNDLGCDYLDAPVSGGSVGAVNAALLFPEAPESTMNGAAVAMGLLPETGFGLALQGGVGLLRNRWYCCGRNGQEYTNNC